MTKNEKYFPDNELNGRSLLAYNWIPENVENLLDAGCSYGYSSVYYSHKAKNTFGIDINQTHIEAAKEKYASINFTQGEIEKLPYESNYFDCVIMMDVLEHTNNQIQSLSEIYRVLKVGGSFIFSTPHDGSFAFLDPYNYGYYLKKKMPLLYKFAFRVIRRLKDGECPAIPYNPEHLKKHYHYSERDLMIMLDKSNFKDKFQAVKLFKSGLYKEVFAMIAESILHVFLSKERTRKIIGKYQMKAAKDFWKEYGRKSYNIAMMIKKTR